MKNSVVSVLLASAIFFTACESVFTGGNNINDAEGLKATKSLIDEQFGADIEVYSVWISAADHLTSEFGMAEISYLDNGVDYSRSYVSGAVKGQELQEAEAASDNFQTEFFLKKKQGKAKLADFDFDQISVKFNEAVNLISDEYESFSLYSWKYLVDNEGAITADFTIECTLKGEGTSVQGRNVVTNYYEFQFELSSEGEIIPKE